jgi:nicotinamidase-related amidase
MSAQEETTMARTQVFFRAAIAAVASLAAVAFSPMALAQGVVGEWATVKSPPAPELKNVMVDPQKTALLVMDFNEGNCTPNPRCAAAIPKVKELLDKARASHALVIYTGYPNMKPYVKDVASMPGEQMLVGRANKFDGTDLDKILKDHGITTVIATGTAPNGAVLFTAFGAAGLGYKVVVPVDTMPGSSTYAEQSSIWGIANDPGLGNMSTLTSVDKIMF